MVPLHITHPFPAISALTIAKLTPVIASNGSILQNENVLWLIGIFFSVDIVFHSSEYFASTSECPLTELLLLMGIVSRGIGNWRKISEHVGTRTKEEVEKHYNEVYVDSPEWPLPVSILQLDNCAPL